MSEFSEIGFPLLSNDRLLLRRVVPGDVSAIREISVYDGVWAESDPEAVEILARIERDYRRGESIHWGICLPGSDEVVGTCGFYRGFAGKVGEVGYILRPAFRGRGIMTAALELVTAYGLNELRLDEIVAYADPSNEPSIAVLLRLGFRGVPSGRDELKFSLVRRRREPPPSS